MKGSKPSGKISNETFVLLSVGSNIGDRQRNIERVFELLLEKSLLSSPLISSFYNTEPVSTINQEWFLNVAISGVTKLEPFKFLSKCQEIEKIIGRKSRKKWHKREIDIDIILFGKQVIKTDALTVPHPRMKNRNFVLVPCVEISGSVIHPVYNQRLSQLLTESQDNSEVKLFA